jgi:hypothetical protein
MSAIDVQNTVLGWGVTQEQFVTVKWVWRTLPTILVVMTFFLFVGACLKTRAAGVGVWISSPLTLLFHWKLPQEIQNNHLKELDRVRGMEASASSLRARITDSVYSRIEVYPDI